MTSPGRTRWPRRNSAAGIGFLPGTWTSRSRTAPWPAATTRRSAVGLEDRAGRAAVLVSTGCGPVDDQPERALGGGVPGDPGGRGDRPGLHGADEVVDGRGGQRPVDQAVFLAELGGPGHPRLVLREDRRGAGGEAAIASATSGAPSAARRSSSSPAVSSGSIGVRAKAIMPPASIRGVIRMTVTPVSVSPFWIARATGAAPR